MRSKHIPAPRAAASLATRVATAPGMPGRTCTGLVSCLAGRGRAAVRRIVARFAAGGRPSPGAAPRFHRTSGSRRPGRAALQRVRPYVAPGRDRHSLQIRPCTAASVAMALVATVLVAGCDRPASGAGRPEDPAPASPAPTAELPIGNPVPGVCPVMGGKVNPERATADPELHAVHEGKRILFCCAGCKSKFEEDPETYLARAGSARGEPERGESRPGESGPGAPAPEGAGTKGTSGASGEARGATEVWYCPMHPTYTSDRPGDCPICNMALVPLGEDEDGADSGLSSHAAVKLGAGRRQLIGVVTEEARKQEVSAAVRTVARVEYDEESLSAVSLKFGGWIEELVVDAVGDVVGKGDPLLVIYSPEVLEAERSYLLALEAAATLAAASPRTAGSGGGGSLAEEGVRSARERLLLWDLAPDQLVELETTKQPSTRRTIRSKVSGTVTRRNVLEGAEVRAGETLYELADLSTVWVLADVFADEASSVAPGQEATLEIAGVPGRVSGALSYVYPWLDEPTRTVRVRMELPNPDGKLRPGMFGTLEIRTPLGEHVVVSESAVLDSGARRLVFVDRGEEGLVPREVEVGRRTGGLATILAGVMPGERVVTSGNFLVDSESRLKAALRESARKASAPSAAVPAAEGAEHGH